MDRDGRTLGEPGFRGSGAGLLAGSLLSHIGMGAFVGDLVPMLATGVVGGRVLW
ncbi:hypothetical protein BDZ91DRAFT_746843 [Kalaharituber pfeilii]|nr:hypothetical protein BDZ91DRAFT_746843 [Kalaharituber pfeilii]